MQEKCIQGRHRVYIVRFRPLLRNNKDAHSSYDHFRLNGLTCSVQGVKITERTLSSNTPPPPLLTSLHPLLLLLSSKFSLLQHLNSFMRYEGMTFFFLRSQACCFLGAVQTL